MEIHSNELNSIASYKYIYTTPRQFSALISQAMPIVS